MADRPPASAQGTVRCEHCAEEHPVSFTHCPRTGKPVAIGRALVGRVFAERYRILGVLGDGGMGTVYLAEHLLIGRKVALKRLHPELASDAKAVARFQREARTAAATGHDNIVDVLDMGYAEDGAPFLVMEYLKGESLAALLRREGTLPAARAANIVGQVLAALWVVHWRGIVHRDLKPDNVFITKRSGRSDYVKVLDFGISKMKKEDEGLALTRTGVTVGTPYYMSPEHARGVKDLDGRADLYAAGVILYECLAGRVPFQGNNYHALLQAILGSTPQPISEVVKDVPAALAAIVHKAIARNPRDRYQDSREMLLELVPFGAVDSGAEDSDPSAPSEEVALLETESLRITTPVASKPPRAPSAEGPVPPSSETRLPTGPRVEARDADEKKAADGSAMQEVVLRDGRVRYAPVPQGPQRASVSSGATPPPSTTPRPRTTTGPKTGPTAAAPPGTTPAPSPPMTTPAPSPPSTTPRPRMSTGPSRGSVVPPRADTNVKGSLILAATEHVTQAQGPKVLDRALATLSAEARATLTGIVMPVGWFPLVLYDALLAALERQLGNGSGAIAQQAGVAAANRDVPTMHRALVQSAPTPAALLERLPALFRLYHQTGDAKIEAVGTSAWRIELRDLAPESFFHAMAMSGFFQRTLELGGAGEVRASVVGSRAHGDERTLIAIRLR